MTVIAWDGKTLAADRRATSGGLVRTTTKIQRIGGLRVGCAGEIGPSVSAMAWVAGGMKPEDFPASQKDKDDWCSILIIEPDNSIVMYERTPNPIRYHDKTFAIGSGRDFALAAMRCGKTAAEAVEIAIEFECGCGNGIDILEKGS